MFDGIPQTESRTRTEADPIPGLRWYDPIMLVDGAVVAVTLFVLTYIALLVT